MKNILNLHQAADSIATGSQPTRSRLSQIANAGQGVVAKLATLALIAPTAFAQAPVAEDTNLHVRIIDVGHGNAVVARMPGAGESGEWDHHYLVYDTGRWEDWERQATLKAVEQVIPHSEEIDLMVLSHADGDHIGGAPEILGAYQVGKIIRPGKEATAFQDDLVIWEAADQAIRAEGAEVLDLSEQDVPAGTRFQFGETTLTLLSGFSVPPEDWGELQPAHERNAPSIVIRLEFAGRSVLFTGDAIGCEHYEIDECDEPIATEKYMLDNSGSVSIKSDVIIAPHHGSISSSSPEFIAGVAPQWVIFTSGHRYELPRTATVDRYIRAGVPPPQILRTDRGDHEGPKEWPQGRIEGCADIPYDDHIDIVITAEGDLAVGYSQPNPPAEQSCNRMLDILNFHQASDNIATGGQPTVEQLSEVADAGYSVVVNLAMHDSDNAIPEEGNVIASLGMSYVHIPVPFEAPTSRHLQRFFRVMESFGGEKVFVHCAVNARVSAFMHRYLMLKKGATAGQATSPLLERWLPHMEEVWKAVLELELDEIEE